MLSIPISQLFVLVVCATTSFVCFTQSFYKTSHKFEQYYLRIESFLHQGGINYPKESNIRIGVLALLISALFGAVISPISMLLFPLFTITGFGVWLKLRIKSQYAQNQNVSDDICFSIARVLRSGQSLEQAIKSVSSSYPKSELLKPTFNLLESGISFSEAVSKSHEQHNNESFEETKLFSAALILSQQMGGNSARIFERIGEYYASMYELTQDCQASLSQVKLSAWVIGALPGAMLLLSFSTGADTLSFLFGHPIGWFCLVFGVGLETAGVMWMRKQIKSGVGKWIS